MREAKGATRRARLSKPEMAQREKAIIADIKAGELSYREIAQKHGVSLPTVNNKARKAGISRGRRKGARLIVPRPARRVAARRVVRKAARRVVKKAVRRRLVAAAVEGMVAGVRRRATRRKVVRKAVRRAVLRKVARRVGRPRLAGGPRNGRRRGGAQSGEAFAGAFRELVLRHFPTISLIKFARLARLVENEVG